MALVRSFFQKPGAAFASKSLAVMSVKVAAYRLVVDKADRPVSEFERQDFDIASSVAWQGRARLECPIAFFVRPIVRTMP